MPKKFQGENSKAVEAKARKAAVANAAAEAKQKAAEDAMWEDDDKQNAKKAARKVILVAYSFSWSLRIQVLVQLLCSTQRCRK